MGGRGQSLTGHTEKKKKITSLNKTIKSLEKQIEEHKRKINDFKGVSKGTKEDKGLIKHWEKEISIFEKNIEKAKEERRKIRKGE